MLDPGEVTRARVTALDGLRGLAITAVVVNHLRPSALPGGWLGVDVFFVLSGYLITSLLLEQHESRGRIDLREFYGRRARRLLPALFVMLAALAIVVRLAPGAPGFDNVRGDGLAALAYVANWHLVLAGASYFGAFAPSPLRHLWSLSLEEQFYLLWPLLLVLLLRRGSRRAVFATALVLAAASAVAMAVAFGNGAHASRAYFGTDTHAHGVLIGAALAALGPTRHRLRGPRTVAGLALAAIGVFIVTLNGAGSVAYRGGIAGVGVLTALVIWAVASGGARNPAAWVLERRPLCALGLISYGLYLWHWPVIVFLTGDRVGVSGLPLVVIQLGCTFALALASYRLIERPVRSGWPRPRWAWIGVPVAAAAVVGMLAIVVPRAPTPFAVAAQAARARSADRIHLSSASIGRAAGAGRGPDRVLVIGDSVAYTLFPGLRAHERAAGLYFLTAAETGCPLDIAATVYRHEGAPPLAADLPADCDWPRRWPAIINRTRPAEVVALWGLWDVYDHKIGEHWLTVGSRVWQIHMERMLERALALVTARGAHMTVLTTPYLFGVRDARVDALDRVYRIVAARHPDRLTVVDIHHAMRALNPQRWDTVHFTVSGADRLGAAVVPRIARVAAAHRGSISRS